MRGNRSQCRPIKRCILFFTAITLLPLAFVYLVTSNDQFYRIKSPNVSKINFICFIVVLTTYCVIISVEIEYKFARKISARSLKIHKLNFCGFALIKIICTVEFNFRERKMSL